MKVKVIQLEQLELRCSNCGSIIRYSPGDKTALCPNCGTVNEIKYSDEAMAQAWEEKDLLKELEKLKTEQIQYSDKQIIKCGACGAEVEFDRPIISAQCPYCGSPIVLSLEQIPRPIKPQGIVPFAITKEQAAEQYKKWALKRWFAPNKFRHFARAPRSLKAMYMPYWTYDAVTTTQYTGERGDYYYVTETYYENGEEKTREVRETRWTPVSGTVRVDFDDILVPGTADVSYIPSSESFDLSEMKPYDARLLSGFYSEAYTIDIDKGFEYAKGAMEPYIVAEIRKDIGGDEQRIHSYKTRYSDLTYKHILLPIYHSVYKYKDKDYPFVINGQTGHVYGKFPVSVWKIIWVILIVLILGLLAFIGAQYNFNFSEFWQNTFGQHVAAFTPNASFLWSVLIW